MSESESPASASACSRKKYGSVPFVAATVRPTRSATSVMSLPVGTAIAAQFGCV